LNGSVVVFEERNRIDTFRKANYIYEALRAGQDLSAIHIVNNYMLNLIAVDMQNE
jgi:hypothetical protein